MRRKVKSFSLKPRRKHKNVVVISDLHCGHRTGMSPPKFEFDVDHRYNGSVAWSEVRRVMWQWYTRKLKSLQPIDILIVNGDMIDGDGHRSGGTELVTTDRAIQADMAVDTISVAKAKQYRLLRGTGYHGGSAESFEDQVADKLKCQILNHAWYDINGLLFDVKHHVAGGGMPHTMGSGIQSDALWNLICSHDSGHPLSDIFIRSHMHTHYDGRGALRHQRVIITPCLQGPGSKYGEQLCRRNVDVGIISFNIKDRDNWTWTKHLMDLKFLAPKVEIL